jgi:predicted component of type VI protein secretion system
MVGSRRRTGDRAGKAGRDETAVDRALRELEAPVATGAPDASALVRRATDVLAAVRHLLDALSPAEIEATAARANLGTDAHAVYWRLFCARHRVLAEVFDTQHAMFTSLSAAYFAQVGRA